MRAEAGTFGSLQISQFSVEGLESRINQFEIAIPTSMYSGGSLKHGYNYFGSGGLFCPDINDSSRGALITNGAIRINGYVSSSRTTF